MSSGRVGVEGRDLTDSEVGRERGRRGGRLTRVASHGRYRFLYTWGLVLPSIGRPPRFLPWNPSWGSGIQLVSESFGCKGSVPRPTRIRYDTPGSRGLSPAHHDRPRIRELLYPQRTTSKSTSLSPGSRPRNRTNLETEPQVRPGNGGTPKVHPFSFCTPDPTPPLCSVHSGRWSVSNLL